MGERPSPRELRDIHSLRLIRLLSPVISQDGQAQKTALSAFQCRRVPCWLMSWHLKCKISPTQPPAPTCLAFSRTGCPRDRDMNCMVHALRELTCSGHQVATHEPKAREQVKVICKALSSESGSIRETWRNPANCGEPEGSVQRDAVGGG